MRGRAQFERSLRAQVAAADLRWGGRNRPWILPALTLAWGASTTLLWRSGYPAWRVAVHGALVMVALACQPLAVPCTPELRGRLGRFRDHVEDAQFIALALGVASIGGLRSPMLLALVTSIPSRIARSGWSRRTWQHLVAICGAVLAMALLPAAWFGPAVAPATFSAVAGLVLVTSALMTTDYMVFLSRTVEESVWDALSAREQAASQALARTRELELMGARLSHELKNPLAAVKALVQLSSRAGGDDEARERLETVESEVERMRDILDEYLSFSRPLEELRLEPVSLGALADEALAVISGRAEEAGVALRREGDAGAVADPRRLKEALLNLVANAVEATPRGGLVTIAVDSPGEVARISVADTGRGMTAEVLQRLGTPFFTTREAGTGLGVLLARATFVQHGGALEYRSAPGEGTTAVATLPRAPAARRSADGEAAAG